LGIIAWKATPDSVEGIGFFAFPRLALEVIFNPTGHAIHFIPITNYTVVET
jgi:hypothetical protein